MTVIKHCNKREQRRHWNSKTTETPKENIVKGVRPPQTTADLPWGQVPWDFLLPGYTSAQSDTTTSSTSDKNTWHRSPHTIRYATWGKGISEGSILTTADALKEAEAGSACRLRRKGRILGHYSKSEQEYWEQPQGQGRGQMVQGSETASGASGQRWDQAWGRRGRGDWARAGGTVSPPEGPWLLSLSSYFSLATSSNIFSSSS